MQRGGPTESTIILYDYDPNRSQSVSLRLLEGFRGYLQSVAYEGYGAVCQANKLISVGCIAHTRRKLNEALIAQKSIDPDKRKSSLAATVLKQIQALYKIERDTKHLSPDAKSAKQ